MKIAVVGSNRGIGLEISKNLINDGHDVFAFCRQSSKELEQAKPKTIIDDFEVTNLKKMETALDKLGVPYFDMLFHVSGILESENLQNFNEDTILTQFKVNSLGPILSAKAFLPYLKKESKIGLLTSRMGSVEDNTSGGMYGYRMSKAALNMAGKSLAEDIKDQGVTVLLLHPGYVKTDMTGHRGEVEPADSAKKLIQLMKEKTLKDTGSFWHINGEELPW